MRAELLADRRAHRPVPERLRPGQHDRERRLVVATRGEDAAAHQREDGTHRPLAGVGERVLRAGEHGLGLGEPVGQERGGGEREVGAAGRPRPFPAVPLGERDRLPRLARGPREVILRARHHRQVGERDEDEPLAAGLGGRAAAALQLALGVVEVARPQLRDPEVGQCQGAQVGLDDAGLEPAAAGELAPGLQSGVEISRASARGRGVRRPATRRTASGAPRARSRARGRRRAGAPRPPARHRARAARWPRRAPARGRPPRDRRECGRRAGATPRSRRGSAAGRSSARRPGERRDPRRRPRPHAGARAGRRRARRATTRRAGAARAARAVPRCAARRGAARRTARDSGTRRRAGQGARATRPRGPGRRGAGDRQHHP